MQLTPDDDEYKYSSKTQLGTLYIDRRNSFIYNKSLVRSESLLEIDFKTNYQDYLKKTRAVMLTLKDRFANSISRTV